MATITCAKSKESVSMTSKEGRSQRDNEKRRTNSRWIICGGKESKESKNKLMKMN